MIRRIGLTFFNKELKAIQGTPSDSTGKGTLIIRALAEGFRDEFTSLWDKGSVDIEEILKSANDHFETFKKLNLESYHNIIALSTATYGEVKTYSIKNIKPEFLRLCLFKCLVLHSYKGSRVLCSWFMYYLFCSLNDKPVLHSGASPWLCDKKGVGNGPFPFPKVTLLVFVFYEFKLLTYEEVLPEQYPEVYQG